MAEKLLFIACDGGIGAALRYVISAWASAHGGAVFPYGTALVNIIGSFLIGLSASYFAVHATLPPRQLSSLSLQVFSAVSRHFPHTTSSSSPYCVRAALHTPVRMLC